MEKAKDEKKYFRIPADLRNINYDIHSNKNKISKKVKLIHQAILID